MKIHTRRLLSRREMVGLMGAAGAAVIVGCGDDDDEPQATSADTPTPETATTVAETEGPGEAATGTVTPDQVSCIVTPDQTEGPFFVDELLERSDITSDPADGSVSPGLPLRLGFVVYRVDGEACEPIEGAVVNVWQCDHLGVYSDVVDFAGAFDTTGRKFLRGHQVTDANGAVEFQTIYPGWYEGRTAHIHFKVNTENEDGTAYEFTSQLYFDDAISDQVYTQSPYTEKQGERGTNNQNDGIAQEGIDQLLLELVEDGEGYSGVLTVGLDLADAQAGADDSL